MCGAQRGANRSFAHTSGNAREQQTGKIGADDQEDSCNGGKEKNEARAGGSDHFGFERQERAQEIDTFVGLFQQFVTGRRSVQRELAAELRRD